MTNAIDRRQFLKLAGLGGVVFASACPASRSPRGRMIFTSFSYPIHIGALKGRPIRTQS